MIEEARYLGIPLRTLRNRRLLVIGFYALLIALAILGLLYTRFMTTLLISWCFLLASLLGGIRPGGPVKYWNESSNPDLNPSNIQQLSLGRPYQVAANPVLDERDRIERDHAHFLAYNILRIVLPLAAIFVLLASDLFPHWLLSRALIFLWALVVLVLSLPQSIILWTEPEPIPELTLVNQPS